MIGLTIALAAGAQILWAARAAQYVEPPEPGPRIAFDEFKKLADKDAVLIVDVRERESYRNGHIPGAVSIPLGEIGARAAELRNAKRPIVTYCA